jgi:hypothetical protein
VLYAVAHDLPRTTTLGAANANERQVGFRLRREHAEPAWMEVAVLIYGSTRLAQAETKKVTVAELAPLGVEVERATVRSLVGSALDAGLLADEDRERPLVLFPGDPCFRAKLGTDSLLLSLAAPPCTRLSVRAVEARIDDTKRGRARTLPLAPQLLEVLRAHRRALVAEQDPGLAAGWVFPGRAGKLLHNSTLRAPMQKVLKAAMIEHWFSVHGFRRTFNNLLREVTQDKVVVRSMTGHSTEEMTEHYSHVALDEKQAAVAKLVRLVPTMHSGDGNRGGDGGGDASIASAGDVV